MLALKSKITFIKIGLISGFIAVLIFLIGTTIAMVTYPGYSFFNQFISELGVRQDVWIQGELLVKAPHPEILNITLILTGIFLIPFFPTLYLILNPKQIWRKILIFSMSLGGLVCGVFLGLVGVFDAGLFLDSHIIVALGAYFTMTLMYFLWGLVVISLNKDSIYKQSKIWILDPIICVIGILVGIINTGLFDIYKYFVGIITLAFYQKLLAYIFVILFTFVGIKMILLLRKNHILLNTKSK